VCSGAELEVFLVQAGELAHPQAGLNSEHEQGVISSPEPSAPVWRSKQGVDLDRLEVTDIAAVVALVGDREDTLDQLGMLGMAERGIAEERVDRCQSRVARAGAVVPLGFEMGEEGADQLRIDVRDVELRRSLAGACLDEERSIRSVSR
jgi:hypothetical protein